MTRDELIRKYGDVWLAAQVLLEENIVALANNDWYEGDRGGADSGAYHDCERKCCELLAIVRAESGLKDVTVMYIRNIADDIGIDPDNPITEDVIRGLAVRQSAWLDKNRSDT